MKNIKKLILSILLLNSSFLIFAYSLSELQTAMSANNPELLKLQEEYARSLLDVKDAKAGFGPTVDLQISGTYMFNPLIDAVYLNVDDIINSIQWPSGLKPESSGQYIKLYDGMENTLYNFQLSLLQPIFTWGKLINAVKLYTQISEIKEIQLLSKEEQLNTELETRIITLTYLKKIMNILDEEKTYAQRLVETSENAEKSGMLIHQDVVEAKIQAKELEIAQQDVTEQINNQLLELQRMTGIENLKTDDFEYELNENKVTEILKSDRTQIEENALSGNQLSIKMLTQLKEVNQIAQSIAKESVNWKPDFALQASIGYGGSRFPFAETNWLRKDDYTANISIGIKTTVWDGGKKLRDVSRKISETKTADINQIDVRSSIRKTLNEQWNIVEVCTMKLEYQDLKIEACNSKITQKETIFNTGYGSETDVLNAKIDKCNQQIEKEKQLLTRDVACMTINYLSSSR